MRTPSSPGDAHLLVEAVEPRVAKSHGENAAIACSGRGDETAAARGVRARARQRQRLAVMRLAAMRQRLEAIRSRR